MVKENEKQNVEMIVRNRERRRRQMGKYQRHAYAKSLELAKTPSVVIAFCNECIGWGTREDIIDCCGFGCPLYFVRPYQYKDTQDVRKQILDMEPKETWNDGSRLHGESEYDYTQE